MKITGRQRLSWRDIEDRSSQLLGLYQSNFFEFIQPTPLLKIAEFLTKNYNIIFDFNCVLGFSDTAQRILGATNLKKRVILIDMSLQQDEHKFNFTLAHELGHLSLHRNLEFEYDESSINPPLETINEFPAEKTGLNSEQEWVEWQANAYASSLLMPETIFRAAIISQQKKMGIGKWGKIFVDEQPCNQADFFSMLTHLRDFFKVSRTAIEYRLKRLNLIEDKRKTYSLSFQLGNGHHKF